MKTNELHNAIVENAIISYSISSGQYSCMVQIRHLIYRMEINKRVRRSLAELLEDFYGVVIDNISNDFIINTLRTGDIKSIF